MLVGLVDQPFQKPLGVLLRVLRGGLIRDPLNPVLGDELPYILR